MISDPLASCTVLHLYTELTVRNWSKFTNLNCCSSYVHLNSHGSVLYHHRQQIPAGTNTSTWSMHTYQRYPYFSSIVASFLLLWWAHWVVSWSVLSLFRHSSISYVPIICWLVQSHDTQDDLLWHQCSLSIWKSPQYRHRRDNAHSPNACGMVTANNNRSQNPADLHICPSQFVSFASRTDIS